MLQPFLLVKLNTASAIKGAAKKTTQPATTAQRPMGVRRCAVRVTTSTARLCAAVRC